MATYRDRVVSETTWRPARAPLSSRRPLSSINAYHVDGDASEIGVLTESAMEGTDFSVRILTRNTSISERAETAGRRNEPRVRRSIGVQVEMRDAEYVTVVAPLEGTHWRKAGLMRGDRIVEVDGGSLKGSGLCGIRCQTKRASGYQSGDFGGRGG